MTAFYSSILAAAITFLIQLRNFNACKALIECLLCSLLTCGVSSGIKAAGLDEQWMVFAGGCIGCLGFNSSVDMAKRLLLKRGKA